MAYKEEEVRIVLYDLFSKKYNFDYTKSQPANCKLVKEIKNYFDNKYPLFFRSGTEIIYCYSFKNNIEKLLNKIICPICGNKVNFTQSFKNGYNHYCSTKCRAKDKAYWNNWRISYKEKTGYDHPCKNPLIKSKIKQTSLNNIDDNGLNSYQRGKLKAKQTFLKKTGVDNYFKTKENKDKLKLFFKDKNKVKQRTQKSKQTKLCKYGNENYNNIEKAQQTNINKIGVKTNLMLQENIEKSKHTKFIKYGNKNYNNIEKHKNTCLNKYGVDNFKKSKQAKELYKNKEWLNNYIHKVYLTKKKNGTFNTSKPENKCFELLKQKYPDTIHGYKSDKYPFNCDLYVPSLDLYIECHFCQYHNYRPFDINNKEHLKELEVLKLKSKEKHKTNNKKNQYDTIIYVWTNLDIRKLKTFKENNLNFKIFYTEEEFKKWYKNF